MSPTKNSPNKKDAVAAWDKYQDSMTQSGGIDDDLREIIECWRAESEQDIQGTLGVRPNALRHADDCAVYVMGADGRSGPCTCGLV